MSSDSSETEALLKRATQRDPEALGALLTRYEGRLKCLVRLRLDRRLQGRIDESDVVQETFLEATRCFPEYTPRPDLPFYLWLRCIATRRLVDLHRHHLGVQARDARREISLNQGGAPEATSAALAGQLLGGFTSPSEVAQRGERKARLEQALDAMEPLDREVLALRHFEQLSNAEAARVLGVQESAASKRHLRALMRLKEILKEL